MSHFHSLTVSEVQKETPNAVSVTLEVPDNLKDTFKFKAGQYITFKHNANGSEIRRSYSLCTPASSGILRVGIKKVDGGTFSVFANEQLSTGTTMEVLPPEGRFVFEPVQGASSGYAAFAAGSGITPVLSIISTALEQEPQSTFLLVYGNRSVEETMFLDEIRRLQASYPDRFFPEFIFSRKQEPDSLFGRIDQSRINYFLKNKYGETSFDRFYLCGPEAMINTATDVLTANGISKEQILFELFTTSDDESIPETVTDGNTEVVVTLDDETETFTMPQNKSVLEAALDEGLDAPYSCQGGICSTCIARVTEGSVEMRKNQILTDSEIEDGLVLTCQSHPTSAKLVIDYDDV